eukprot:gene15838-33395_t
MVVRHTGLQNPSRFGAVGATVRRRFNPYNAVSYHETNCAMSNHPAKPSRPPAPTLAPAPRPMASADAEPGSGGVIAVTRALQVLEAFALGESSLPLAELSRRCGLHKTTVLRLIGGQLRAQKGQTLFDGQDITVMRAEALYAARRRMGMLFQFGALFTDMSVFDNVAFPLHEHTKLPEALVRDIVLMKLNAVGLRGARDLMPSELSVGLRGARDLMP